MTALPEEFFDRLRQSCDIGATMSSYVTLKPAGRDFVCSCPFHSEKTPSCHVYTDTQSFYCFGCGAGGDVITFIRLIENLGYMEAVRFLAQRNGITMPEEEHDDDSRKRVRILEMNRAAARYFRDTLLSPEGEEGMNYLIQRQLSPNTIRKYGLGYAPDEWKRLLMFLRGKGFTDDEVVSGALAVRNNKSVYDKFRHRVIFPIIDKTGNVIGFGGRALEKDAPAKYLNSDETAVFHKRKNLFSLNFAKNSKENYLIMCEGYMDVISMNQAGFENAVATLGTAVTPEQVRLVNNSRFQNVVLSYDNDEAGQKASMKAINLFSEVGIEAKVLQMTGAKDPDEYIKKFGAESFRMLVEKSGSAIDFELQKLKNGLNMSTPEGRATYLKKAVPLLAEINNSLDRTVYTSVVAKECEISPENIKAGVDEFVRKRGYFKEKEQTRNLIRDPQKRDKLNPDADKYPAEAKAERGLIAFLFHSPDLLQKILSRVAVEDFPTAFHRKVFELLTLRLKNNESIEMSALGGEFSPDEMGRITGIQAENNILPYTHQRLEDYIKVLLDFKEKQQGKSAADMSAGELLEMMERVKKGKGF